MKLKVLMIGNSFSICVGKNLPQIVRAGNKHQLVLTSAFIGGCPLQKHAENLEAAAADLSFAPYRIDVWNSGDLRKRCPRMGNVLELLRNNVYDIVTVQQASALSWKFSSYYPWADTVIAAIRKYQPNAEILIQETWSYRADTPLLETWGFDNTGMYLRLKEAYSEFSGKTGFKIIPTGSAVQLYRQESKRVFCGLSDEERAKFLPPDLPSMANDVVGKDYWSKNEEGELVLGRDTTHLNFRGEYLQACVWYGKLFGEDPETISYEHPDISRSECRFMRRCAGKVLS